MPTTHPTAVATAAGRRMRASRVAPAIVPAVVDGHRRSPERLAEPEGHAGSCKRQELVFQ